MFGDDYVEVVVHWYKMVIENVLDVRVHVYNMLNYTEMIDCHWR